MQQDNSAVVDFVVRQATGTVVVGVSISVRTNPTVVDVEQDAALVTAVFLGSVVLRDCQTAVGNAQT